MEEKIGPRSNRYTIKEPITEIELTNILSDSSIKVLQTNTDLLQSSWELINRIIVRNRDDITIRLFGFYGKICDVFQISNLKDVKNLSIDCINSAINSETLYELRNLESLTIGIFELTSFEFLEGINDQLIELRVLETRSTKPDLSILSRFTNLKRLTVGGHSKGIETINQLKSLQRLFLGGISTPDLSYIIGLDGLEELVINLGGIKDLDTIGNLKKLKYLELFQIRGLENIHFIEKLKSLQYLHLQNLPNIKSLPNMKDMDNLTRVIVDNLKGLNDFTGVAQAPNLHEFCLYSGNKQSTDSVAVILNNKSLKRIAAYFGSQLRNDAFRDLISKANIDFWNPIKEFEYI